MTTATKNASVIPGVLLLGLLCLSLPACSQLDAEEGPHKEAHHEEEAHKIIVTSPVRMDVTRTQPYVCQIHSRRHIEVRALEGGYLDEILVNEGQAVKEGDLMFRIRPVLFKARMDSDVAEAQLAKIEYDNTRRLYEQNVVAKPEVALAEAKLAKAQAKVELAKAELGFTEVKAPFDGIVDRQRAQQGSLIEEGDVLTTLSDNNLMWVYFNVPESDYLEYKAEMDRETSGDNEHSNLKLELKLANDKMFPEGGKIGAIEADFDNTTGNIPFRADFPNPNGLLRNGQTGTVKIHRTIHNALVIPQRATFEILAKQFVFVVDEDNVVHQRLITIEEEQEDIFVIKDGLQEGDKIIFEGVREVRDGDKIEFDFHEPQDILANLKSHAE
ncbi:MAG: efflux RND transporter periplasmic adaptor subunit [Planctomycetaceae bacterium]|nr:efflux RND transporter periplasmic adaptor subunit [Planctomycetaceae bacterium]